MTKFPDGISGTASKVHALGLKFGIYSDAGKTTCGGYPASLGYEVTDAQTFANWGVDYLKYDNCDVPSNWADQYQDCVPSDTSNVGPQGQCPKTSSSAPAGYNWGTSNTAKRYGAMRDAILKTGRPMLFSLCNWGGEHVWEWGKSVGHSWRISGDVYPSWNRITAIANWNAFILQYTNFWGHNDADMLEVGNGQLTSQETRSHFALWAAMKSPLIIGTDLSKLPQADVDLLKNQYLLKFHQDNTYGGPATPFKWNRQFNPNHPTCQYWSGDATAWVFVLVFNSADSQQTLSFKWTDVPQLRASSGQRYTYTDGWTGQAHNCVSNGVSVTLAAHDSAIYAVQRNHC
jgi:alpha-galactosidase